MVLLLPPPHPVRLDTRAQTRVSQQFGMLAHASFVANGAAGAAVL